MINIANRLTRLHRQTLFIPDPVLTPHVLCPGFPGVTPGLQPHLLPAFTSAVAAASAAAKLSSEVTSSGLSRMTSVTPEAEHSVSSLRSPHPASLPARLSPDSRPSPSKSGAGSHLSASTPRSELSDDGKRSGHDDIAEDEDMETGIVRPSSAGAMSSGSVDEDLEDESMSHEDEGGDIAEAEDLSIKAHVPTKMTEVDSSTLSPASNSLIGELMSKFGFNDIQEYQVSCCDSLQCN